MLKYAEFFVTDMLNQSKMVIWAQFSKLLKFVSVETGDIIFIFLTFVSILGIFKVDHSGF